MMVLCDNCHNHYDDSFQEGPESCDGPGRSSKSDSKNRVGHGRFATQPIRQHIEDTRAARMNFALGKVERSGRRG